MSAVKARWMDAYRLTSFVALAISLLSAVSLAFIYVSSENITLGGQEQNVIFGVQTLLLGHDLYQDPGKLPFVATQYTPIFYEVCARISHVLGLSPDRIRDIYLVSRTVSAMASLGCCLTIYRLLACYTSVDKTMRLALAFFFPLSINPWPFIARPDPLYLLLIAAALLTAMRYARTANIWMLVISAVLLVAGFYTKQTALFYYPLPFAVVFARQGWRALRPRDIAICATVYVTGFVFLSQAMIGNFAVGLGNGIDLRYAMSEAYLPTVLQHIPLLAAAAIGCWQVARRAPWETRAILIATLYFLCVGTGTALKWGSSTNYFDEFFIGCILLTGIGLSSVVTSDRRADRMLAFVLVGLVIAGQIDTAHRGRGGLVSALAPRLQLYQGGYALAADPELRGKPILVLDFRSMLFIPERAVFSPFEVLGTSALNGHFDLNLVTNLVHEKKLCYAVTDDLVFSYMSGTASTYENWGAWMRTVGPALLADFEVSKRIGTRILLTSKLCEPTVAR